MQQRGLAESLVRETVDKPDLVKPDSHDDTLENSYKRVDEADGRVLKVVTRTSRGEQLVITAYFDRSMRGEL